MKRLIKYIKKLECESFEGWTEESKKGYLTACVSIKEFTKKLNKNECQTCNGTGHVYSEYGEPCKCPDCKRKKKIKK